MAELEGDVSGGSWRLRTSPPPNLKLEYLPTDNSGSEISPALSLRCWRAREHMTASSRVVVLN
jgi:hypothetical protein